MLLLLLLLLKSVQIDDDVKTNICNKPTHTKGYAKTYKKCEAYKCSLHIVFIIIIIIIEFNSSSKAHKNDKPHKHTMNR